MSRSEGVFVEKLTKKVEITLISVEPKVLGKRGEASLHDVEELFPSDHHRALHNLDVPILLRKGDEPSTHAEL